MIRTIINNKVILKTRFYVLKNLSANGVSNKP